MVCPKGAKMVPFSLQSGNQVLENLFSCKICSVSVQWVSGLPGGTGLILHGVFGGQTLSLPTMANDTSKFQAIISHSKEYGFIFPSSEIYDGLSAVYDYGQYGSELKKNIKDHWWKSMTQLQENIVGIDAAIFMHPTIWKASGHVDNFSDPMIDNKDSQKRYRVDHLIEARIEELEKERKKSEADALQAELDKLIAASDFPGLKKLIEDKKIKCGISGTSNWTEVRQFNLMFSTQLGSVSEEASEIYVGREPAQGLFVNFPTLPKQ